MGLRAVFKQVSEPSPGNEALLNEYLARRRVKPSTEEVYEFAVKSWNRLVATPLEDVTGDDVFEWYRQASESGLEAATLLSYAYILRKLVQFSWRLRGLPKLLAWAKSVILFEDLPFGDLIRERKRRQDNRDVLVTGAEFETLMVTAKNPRTRAYIAVLADSSGRVGEIMGLRIKDVTIDGDHGELLVEGKTGVRVLPITWSIPYMETWLDAHPDPRDSNPLFCTILGGRVKQVCRGTASSLLTYLCRKAGLRHITPGMLRHTRLTDYRRKGLPDAQFRKLAGWTPDSRQPARYEHLTGTEHVPACLEVELRGRSRPGTPIEED